MLFIVKNIFLLAENEDFPRSLSKLPKEWQNESDDLKKRLNYNGDIHFIIGPWGSGKSTFISTLLSNNDYFRRPQRISLSTATTQDEIFAFLIRPGVKFLYVVIALLSIYISSRYFTLADFYQEVVSNNPTIASIVALFVALFITNRFRLFYIVSSYLEPLLGKQIKIIEDYDRGNLDHAEIYNTLVFRNRWRTSYLVLLGWNSIKQRDDYIDLGLKLGSNITIFDISSETTYAIFLNLYKSIPYINHGEWIKLFTPRKIISLITQINNISTNKDTDESVKLLWLIIFNEIVKSIEITDSGILNFSSTGRELNHQTEISSHQRKIINSFLSSLDGIKFDELAKKHSSASNQGQVFSRTLFIKQISGIAIPDIVRY